MRMPLAVPVCAILLAASLLLPTPSLAQELGTGCPKADERTCGEVLRLTAIEASSLLLKFRSTPEEDWGSILKTYFGELYNRDFLDWVVFIQKDGHSRQGLFDKGTLVTNNIVRGHQSLAILVFAESTFKPDSPGAKTDSPIKADSATDAPATGKADTVPGVNKQKSDSLRLLALARDCKIAGLPCKVVLTYSGDESKPTPGAPGELVVNRATLQYTRDPGLIALLKGLTGGIVGPAADATAVPDSSAQPLILDDGLRTDEKRDSTGFYFGYRRMQIPLNALVRFTIRPNRDKAVFQATTSISRTIENASRNRFGASLGTGLTLGAPDSTFAIVDSGRSITVSSSSNVKPRLWLMAHFAVIRPLLPIRPQDLSVVFGTNLSTDDLFRDLLVGLGVGRLIGDVGVVTGLNFIQRRSATPETNAAGTIVGLPTREYRRAKWFFGLDFAL